MAVVPSIFFSGLKESPPGKMSLSQNPVDAPPCRVHRPGYCWPAPLSFQRDHHAAESH